MEGGTPHRAELVCELGGERYHVLTEEDARSWVVRPVPTQEANREPEQSLPLRSFHDGAGFSYAGAPNVYERANGWDASAPGKISTWAMHATGESFDAESNYKGWVIYFAGRVYVLRGRYAYWYTPTTSAGVEWTHTLSKDFGTGNVVCGRPAQFKGKLYVPIADASSGANQDFWELTSTGSPDTWTRGTDLPARAFFNWHKHKTGAAVLVRADEGSVYTVAGDPLNTADWSAEQQIGDPGKIVTDHGVWQDMLLPAKENGLFSVSAIEVAVNELPDLEGSEDTFNGVGMATSNNWVLIPHKSGLIRYQPGNYRFVGPQQEGALEADITPGWGRVNHVAPYGKYAFVSANDTVNGVGSIYSLEPSRGDRGPLVPHSRFQSSDGYYEGLAVVQDSSDVSSYLVAILADGATTSLHTWQLPRSDYAPGSDPSIVKARDDAQFFTSRYFQPGREVQKSWRAVEFYLEMNPESNTPGLEVYAYIDEGAATQLLDDGGAAATLLTSGFHTVYFPRTASGTYCQLEFRIPALAGGEVNVAATVRDIVLYMDVQPKMVDAVTATLVLGSGDFEDYTTMRRTAWQQLQDLKGLQGRQDEATLIKDPWGEEWYGNVMVDNWREMKLKGHSQSSFLADVTIRGRPYGA